MSEEWDDNPAVERPSYETQVFTSSHGSDQANWRDDSQQSQRKYNNKSGQREDGGGYRGGNNRGPRRQNYESEDATMIKVPSKFVGRIIGRGGSKISDLQLESGARINVTKEIDGDQTVIRLIGSDDAVTKAESLIRDLTIEREGSSYGNYERRDREGSGYGNYERQDRDGSSYGNYERRDREARSYGNYQRQDRDGSSYGNYERRDREA